MLRGIDESEFDGVLKTLGAYKKSFPKNHIIRHSETEVNVIGIIIKGLVYFSKCDINGNRIILSEIGAGKSFGESLTFTRAQNSPIIITAAKDTTVIFFPSKNILNQPCGYKYRDLILENVIRLLAEKVMLLQMKIDILSQKTTKEKLLLYFEYESKTAGSNSFKINFSRDELADFLSLNSSALSRELSKMRDEGIITFKKNKFVLK